MTLLLKVVVVWLLINAVYFWWMVDGRYVWGAIILARRGEPRLNVER